MDKLEFKTKKTCVAIDYERCLPARERTSQPACGFACVKACRLYGRSVLKIEDNRPVLAVTDPEEILRLDNECLACEVQCALQGQGCIHIDIPL